MHPEINIYYNDLGYVIGDNLTNIAPDVLYNSWTIYYFAYKGSNIIKYNIPADFVVATAKISGPIMGADILSKKNLKVIYDFGDKRFNEEQALKVIKLKAFL